MTRPPRYSHLTTNGGQVKDNNLQPTCSTRVMRLFVYAVYLHEADVTSLSGLNWHREVLLNPWGTCWSLSVPPLISPINSDVKEDDHARYPMSKIESFTWHAAIDGHDTHICVSLTNTLGVFCPCRIPPAYRRWSSTGSMQKGKKFA